jgi:hypothetical protein
MLLLNSEDFTEDCEDLVEGRDKMERAWELYRKL